MANLTLSDMESRPKPKKGWVKKAAKAKASFGKKNKRVLYDATDSKPSEPGKKRKSVLYASDED